MDDFQLSIFQSVLRDETPQARLSWLDMAAERAAANGDRLVVCPELSLTGPRGHARLGELAQPRGGEYDERVAEIAFLHDIAILFGYPEAVGRRLYNTVVLASASGEIIGRHRKNHIPDPDGENAFAAGSGVTVHEVDGWKLAVLVGQDVVFPELARQAALAGAELLIVPTATSQDDSFLLDILCRARAHENGAYVICANWAEKTDRNGAQLCGTSRVIGPDGAERSNAGKAEAIHSCILDRESLTLARKRLDCLRDYRQGLQARDAPNS